jgi:hypothetical protein
MSVSREAGHVGLTAFNPTFVALGQLFVAEGPKSVGFLAIKTVWRAGLRAGRRFGRDRARPAVAPEITIHEVVEIVSLQRVFFEGEVLVGS